MNPVRLIIFDCDGVLVDSETLSARALQDVLRTCGAEVPMEAIGRCVGMKQADIIASLEQQTGRTLSPWVDDALWPATRALFADHLAATAGLAAFLQLLTLPRCVASSSSHERIAFSLRVTGLDGYFGADAIFSSSDVARGKPAPDLFLRAARQMGVAPEHCVVIEDSRFGIEGAVAAGMIAIGFAGGSHAGPAMEAALMASGALGVERSWPGIARRLGLDLPV